MKTKSNKGVKTNLAVGTVALAAAVGIADYRAGQKDSDLERRLSVVEQEVAPPKPTQRFRVKEDGSLEPILD